MVVCAKLEEADIAAQGPRDNISNFRFISLRQMSLKIQSMKRCDLSFCNQISQSVKMKTDMPAHDST